MDWVDLRGLDGWSKFQVDAARAPIAAAFKRVEKINEVYLPENDSWNAVKEFLMAKVPANPSDPPGF